VFVGQALAVIALAASELPDSARQYLFKEIILQHPESQQWVGGSYETLIISQFV
jgi:hypothetical protein